MAGQFGFDLTALCIPSLGESVIANLKFQDTSRHFQTMIINPDNDCDNDVDMDDHDSLKKKELTEKQKDPLETLKLGYQCNFVL